MPKRVQRTRKPGQPGIPPGAVYVGRGRGDYGRWGNPFKAEDALEYDFAETIEDARAYVTRMYRDWLNGDMGLTSEGDGTTWSRERRDWILEHIGELAGKDLACWCPIPEPGQPDHCHATVLIRKATAHLIRTQLSERIEGGLTVREQATAADAYGIIQAVEGPDIARAWMIGQNPHLDDQAPILAIQDGHGRDVLTAARAYVQGVCA